MLPPALTLCSDRLGLGGDRLLRDTRRRRLFGLGFRWPRRQLGRQSQRRKLITKLRSSPPVLRILGHATQQYVHEGLVDSRNALDRSLLPLDQFRNAGRLGGIRPARSVTAEHGVQRGSE